MKEYNQDLNEEIEIDENMLFADIDEIAFEDTYGNGVCIIGNNIYKTYHELAEHFNLNVLDYVKN